jgi:hypothetical protein
MKTLLTTAALAASLTLAAIPAKSDAISVGWWDNINGVPSGVTTIYSQPSYAPFTLDHVAFGPTFFGVLSALRTPDGYYESAINNVFTNIIGTARIYTSFSDVQVTGDISIPALFPSIFQKSEDALPTWTLVEQIFACPNSVTYCDNFIVPGGTMIGQRTFGGSEVGTDFFSLTGIIPGVPFNITEVFHIVANTPDAHLAGAILTQPLAQVPGPIVGAGLPGLMLLLAGWLGRRWLRIA